MKGYQRPEAIPEALTRWMSVLQDVEEIRLQGRLPENYRLHLPIDTWLAARANYGNSHHVWHSADMVVLQDLETRQGIVIDVRSVPFEAGSYISYEEMELRVASVRRTFIRDRLFGGVVVAQGAGRRYRFHPNSWNRIHLVRQGPWMPWESANYVLS